MKLSVIIPFHNEEGNVDFVLQEVLDVLAGLGCEYEIIAVDDFSRDRTLAILNKWAGEIKSLSVIAHARNLGQGVSLWQGLRQSSGDLVVFMDGDGQNDFRDIPGMLPLLERFDAVLGQRSRRQDPPHKLMAAQVAYFFRRLILGDTVRDVGCSLKVMKREVVRSFIPIRSFHLFIPFMLTQAGVPFTTRDVHHRPRARGRSHYSLWRLYFIPNLLDLLFMWRFRCRNLYQFEKKTGM